MGISLNSNIPTATAYVSSASGASASGASGASASSGVTATAPVPTKEVVMYTAKAPGTDAATGKTLIITTTTGATTTSVATGGTTSVSTGATIAADASVAGNKYNDEEKEAILENYGRFCEQLRDAFEQLSKDRKIELVHISWATITIGSRTYSVEIEPFIDYSKRGDDRYTYILTGIPSSTDVANALENGDRVTWRAWNGAQ